MDIRDHSDEELLSNVSKLVGSYRHVTARLVAYLAEIEDRRLHLVMGFSSMFEFCVKELGFSENEAFRRILAARLARRFPVLYSLLASGGVSLSTLQLIRKWLSAENHEELLAAVRGKSKCEVEVLLATRFPRPDAPTRFRQQGSFELQGNIRPLSERRFEVSFTASDELREKLERCRDLMSHANPSRDLGIVIERAVDLLLSDLERKRLGKASRPKAARDRQESERSNISTAVRREVFERDGLRCTYVAGDGRRCEARAFLEMDHIKPRAVGGSNEARNLRIRCRAHNQLWAEQAFGREHVQRRRHLRQKRLSAASMAGATPANLSSEHEISAPNLEMILAKVHLALCGLGFRDAEARRAIAKVAQLHPPRQPLAVEEALLEALRAVTAA